ncbi:beta-N-acetylhexosaminidase [uncultured Parabacteroides sp.]|uniref:beta-N-acetylhexosaminidase n=1 Tax=uncultured Parabacteroides sp. TaxID=512312 RepID=UPI00259667F6|nr:beta-N-acetylhexosaminidase [uncultured Parabacteroides sp.]
MKVFICFIMLLCTTCIGAQDNCSALMPMPNSVVQGKGNPFEISANKTTIYVNHSDLEFSALTLQKILNEQMQLEIPLSESSESSVRLLIDPEMKGEEHYCIEVNADKLLIRGASCRAVFYGVMTLDQLFMGDVCMTKQKRIAPVVIDDSPRFPYRALMIDPARHFLPVEDVKFYIDQMVRYKYNILQLHLTDDQGWRIEIKKHPQLASPEHYTQEELQDLIQYAALRNVEIIPELDVPGHTVSILATCPELGCTSSDTIVREVGKTTNLMLCASNEKVYSIYDDIIDEVADLFPSKYIHLGGDESVIDKNWGQCEKCQAQMKQLGYQKASQLMIPFFNRMFDFLKQKRKLPILWCELDSIHLPVNDFLFPYPKHVTLVSWRGQLTPACLELTTRSGNALIMAPGEYAYLDYPQLKGDLPEFNNWGMPVTTLKQCYQFDPGYGVPENKQTHIQGIMGTLWGEAMLDINRVTYMTYPRAMALAEAGWTTMENRDWESFKQRLYPNLTWLMKKGVFVRVPFEIVNRSSFCH